MAISDLEMKRDLLMMQIENELISIEKYAENIESKINEQKSLALALGKAGKKEDQKRCLMRVKLMQNELDS